MKSRRERRQVFVVGCGLILALGMGAASATTIQEARNLGAGATAVTVRGIVTATQFGQPIHIQDATAAIAVYGATGAGPAVGDEVQVTGDLVDFSSLLEFGQGCTLQILASGNPLPDPLVLTTDQIAADATDAYESKLVRVEDVLTFSTGNFAGNTNYIFENLDGAIQVRIDRDTELVGTPIPTSNVHITGILGQYRGAYQLQPRALADIVIAATDFDPPTVENVAAEDATHVVVTYNEPVDPDTAADPLNYTIDRGIEVAAAAMVLSAGAHTQVRLTVSAMAVGLYQLTVSNVEDLRGNVLELATRQFVFGVDSDSDGMSDVWESLHGLVVGTDDGADDPDGDNLPNVGEFHARSDPHKPDTDEDGLSDGEEIALGTDPRQADTDGDGLTDGREANELSTDPLNLDTDGDGLSDSAEVALGTSPIRPDSDSDGLTDGQEQSLTSTDPLVPDTDGDGMPDGWEWVHELVPLDPDDGKSDPDGDRFRNRSEYAARTDPHDPSDYLRIHLLKRAGNTADLRWFGKAGRQYQVLFCTDFRQPMSEWTVVPFAFTAAEDDEQLSLSYFLGGERELFLVVKVLE